MQKVFCLVLVLSLLIVGTSVLAQGGELPAGITPDSPFYFLKTWKESIQIFFTFGAENKAKQFLRLADVKLAEYRKMVEKGKMEIAAKTLEKYENQIDHSLAKIGEASKKGADIKELAKTASEKIVAHQKVLAEASNKGINSLLQQKLEEGLKQSPPTVQNCAKSILGNLSEQVKRGEFKGAADIPAIIKDCLPAGTKIPSGGGINMELLNKMQEFYGNSLPAKDLEALKRAQEQLKGIIPQGTAIPSSGKTFNLDDVKRAQEKMQEEYNKIPPEKLEQIKKMQEQGQFEDAAPPEIQGGGSGMGL